MKIEYTPGPWEIGYLDKNGQRVVKNAHTEVCTCWHHSVGSIEREMEVNARLIAAAPDLFEALQRLVWAAEEGTRRGRAMDMLPKKEWNAALAAIAKVTLT